MRYIDHLFILFLGVSIIWMLASCIKQSKPDELLQYEPPPELLELDEEELGDLPEDTGEDL